MEKTILIVTLFASVLVKAQTTQDVLGASGSTATGSGGSLSYTVGQVGYTSNSNSSGSLNAGFQQAYEISETTGLEETNVGLQATAYPNPTTNFLTLSVKDLSQSQTYQIIDFNGKEIANGKLSTTETQLDFGSYVGGIYSVKITTNKNKIIKTFQVIKH